MYVWNFFIIGLQQIFLNIQFIKVIGPEWRYLDQRKTANLIDNKV